MGEKLDKLIESLTEKFQTYLPRLGFMFLLFSVALFLLWGLVTVIWPVNDLLRVRSSISLPDGRKLVLDYPKRFLADGNAYPVYLSSDASSPLTAELNLSSELPLILTNIEPQSAVSLTITTSGNTLLMTWPVSSTVPILTPQATSVITPTGRALPFEKGPTTITLYFKNAQTKGPFYSCCGWTFKYFEISSQGKTYSKLILIEGAARAHLRVLADKYSFLAILPLLGAGIGFLIKNYADYKKQQKIDASKKLEEFIRQVSLGDISKNKDDNTANSYTELKKRSKYLDNDRWILAQKLNELCSGDISRITANDFEEDTDAWAGALIVVYKKCYSKNSSDPKNASHSKNISDCRNDYSKFYSLIRTFPRYKLSSKQLVMFDEMVASILGSVEPLKWPQRSFSNLQNCHKPKFDDPNKYTLAGLQLFPYSDARNIEEQCDLFKEKETFWRLHPVYAKLVESSNHFLVYGPAGVGRTALALALTRYGDPNKPVLGCYYNTIPHISTIQHDLIEELSRVIVEQSFCLRELKSQEQRELLATLLVSARSSSLLRFQLSNFSDSSDNSQSDSPVVVRKEEAILERKLLGQTIENINIQKSNTLSPRDWFFALKSVLEKLGFKRGVVVALDLAEVEAISQLSQEKSELYELMDAFKSSVQVIICVNSSGSPVSTLPMAKVYGITDIALTWTADELKNMVEYRFNQRGIVTELIGGQLVSLTRLIGAALNNPRHLANLWQRLTKENPEEYTLTDAMVTSFLGKEGHS